MKRQQGFTLIELMIVMVIITILAGIGLAVYGNSVQSSKEAVMREDLFRMREAIDQYHADKNRYPATLEALVEDKYLRHGAGRSDYEVGRHLANDDGRPGAGKSLSRTGNLQREEWRRRHRAGRHPILRVVDMRSGINFRSVPALARNRPGGGDAGRL